MKYVLLPLSLVVCGVFGSCDDHPVATDSGKPNQGGDLHEAEGIRIIRSSDGLERTIKIHSDEWLGDRYSPPKCECEASSIGRLLRFVAEESQFPITVMEGAKLLPEGTFLYSFGDRTWENEHLIFDDVVAATEVAFGLDIVVTNSGE